MDFLYSKVAEKSRSKQISFSGSESESDFSSMFMNLNICIFLPYIYTFLNKFADNFFYQFS